MPTRIPVTDETLKQRHAAVITKGKRLKLGKKITQDRLGVRSVIDVKVVRKGDLVALEHTADALTINDPAINLAVSLLYTPKKDLKLEDAVKKMGFYDTSLWEGTVKEFNMYKTELKSITKKQREVVLGVIYG